MHTMEFYHVMVSTVFHRDPSCLVGQMELHAMTSTCPLTWIPPCMAMEVCRWNPALLLFQHMLMTSIKSAYGIPCAQPSTVFHRVSSMDITVPVTAENYWWFLMEYRHNGGFPACMVFHCMFNGIHRARQVCGNHRTIHCCGMWTPSRLMSEIHQLKPCGPFFAR
jgi:hypothetical protein